MILLTGDIHGNAIGRFSYKRNPFLRNLGEKDFMIVLGDFGIPFGVEAPYYNKNQKNDKNSLDFLESKKFTTLALAGNHDDRSFIKQLPQVKKFGGTVREMIFDNKHYNNIYYIDQPTVLTLEGKKCLFIPGARSHDIFEGIIDPEKTEDVKKTIKEYIKNYKVFFRVKNWDWWADEDIDIEAVENIVSKEQEFDYVFSHACPLEYLLLEYPAFSDFEIGESEKYLKMLAQKLDYKHWYHGHMHLESFTYHNNITCLYRDFKAIKE